MTDEQKQTRLVSFIAMIPQLAANYETVDSAYKQVLNAMAKSDNPVPFGAALMAAGNEKDAAWDELERVKTVISYIQETPADQLTELSVGAVYAKS